MRFRQNSHLILSFRHSIDSFRHSIDSFRQICNLPELNDFIRMIHFSHFLYLSVFLAATALPVYADGISGRVFRDDNANGRFDRGERLLLGIGISDGDTIVWSDRHGFYSLSPKAGSVVFPILPDGYEMAVDGVQNRGGRMPVSDSGTVDFGLRHVGIVPDLRIAVLGDIQADTPEQLELARKTVIGEVASREDISVVLHMGDLVNDCPELLPAAAGALGLMPQSVWTVIGNHDLDMNVRPRTGRNFRTTIGCDIAAFFRGHYCFVLLNNVENASEGLSDSQLRFLGQLVSRCPEATVFVLCQHIPMGGVKNRETVFRIMDGHRVLILSAHAHTTFRKEWSDSISELSVGATCGSWWTGEHDPWGIPVALQQCGTPRGYFLFDFSNDGYSFSFKGVGMDSDIQSDLWISGTDPADSLIEPLDSIPRGRLCLNVYGGGESTTVEYSADRVHWYRMERTENVSPAVFRVIYMNRHGGYPTAFSRRTPLRRGAPSYHLWEAQLPDTLMTGERWLYFRVLDDRGLEPFHFQRLVNLIENGK